MKVFPARRAERPRAYRRLITLTSPEMACAGSVLHGAGAASSAWPAANDPYAQAFRLSDSVVVEQIGVLNGTSAGGQFDMGIYDTSWTRLVSSGSTGGSGGSVWQFVNITDTPLVGGVLYYLAMSRDNITANRQRYSLVGGTVQAVALAGGFDSGTDAFPLPNPLTNMAAATLFASVPIMCLAVRAPF